MINDENLDVCEDAVIVMLIRYILIESALPQTTVNSGDIIVTEFFALHGFSYQRFDLSLYCLLE